MFRWFGSKTRNDIVKLRNLFTALRGASGLALAANSRWTVPGMRLLGPMRPEDKLFGDPFLTSNAASSTIFLNLKMLSNELIGSLAL